MVDLSLSMCVIIVKLLKEHSSLGLDFLSSVRGAMVVTNSLGYFKGDVDDTSKANDITA